MILACETCLNINTYSNISSNKDTTFYNMLYWPSEWRSCGLFGNMHAFSESLYTITVEFMLWPSNLLC